MMISDNPLKRSKCTGAWLQLFLSAGDNRLSISFDHDDDDENDDHNHENYYDYYHDTHDDDASMVTTVWPFSLIAIINYFL